MTILIAASMLMSPIASDQLEVGAAAYYAQTYDQGVPSGWERIIRRRITWGQIDPETFIYSPAGYYCVHPGSRLGDRLRVMNAITGTSLVCTVADVVAPADLRHWKAEVIIELSHRAFVDAGGQQFNRFVITNADEGE